ncbi:MAG: hypothetical protein KAS65_00070 [Candidatus Aminicenantes bacterium]|nr:hypothetical protein [Candidatus Aminicenantes bacterium]
MLSREMIRRIGILTIVLFGWFSLSTSFGYAQEEDALLKARKLYQQGYYDDAITMLIECINKLKSIVAQKKNVAEAFYLLAKVYFTVGEDDKVNTNLKKLFETYPTFEKEDTDMEFKERVDQARANLVISKEVQVQTDVEIPTEVKPEPEKVQPVIKTEEEKPGEDIEQIVIPKVKKKKKKKFPILLVLGGLALAAVAAYFLFIKKSEDEGYDIRGSWSLNFNWYSKQVATPGTTTITFSGGSKNGGTFVVQSYSGSWTVTGSQVRWVFQSGTTYSGTIQSDTYMSGTMVDYNGSPGYWSASRTGAKSRTGVSATTLSPDCASPK